MSELSWDELGIEEAKLIARKSKDPSTKCGAYIADKYNRPVSKGFNGLPRKIEDNPDKLKDRQWKYARTLHAEMNSILFAERDKLEGSTIYVTHPVCTNCAAAIIQVGISKVVFENKDESFFSRWGKEGINLLKEAGIKIEQL